MHAVRHINGRDIAASVLRQACVHIKALYRGGIVYILMYKRLMEERFQWLRSEVELKKLTLLEFR